MNRASQVVVPAEDERQQRFVRSYLYRLRYTQRDIRFEALPTGRGCGEQWVRGRYAAAVRAYRARASRAKTALIVIIDADQRETEHRVSQFREALNQAQLQARAATERIAHLIPKRNIETWVLCLVGRDV